MKSRTKNIRQAGLITVSLLIGVIAFIFMWNFNRFSGYTADDYLYHFVYQGEWPNAGATPYHNLIDWIRSIYTHMTTWNARLTSVVFEIGAMQIPKWLFNIINALIYIILGFLINLVVSGKRALQRPIMIALTFLMMWFYLPTLGNTVFWASGAANYLWPTVLMLLFVLPYRFGYFVKRRPGWMNFGMAMLGILVAMTNEVGGATVVFVALAYSLIDFNQDGVVESTWKVAGTAIGGIAFLTMLHLSTGAGETQSYGKSVSFPQHVVDIITGSWHYAGILVLPLLALGIILYLKRNFIKRLEKDAPTKRTLISGLIFLIAGLLGCGALVASPILPGRMWFNINVLFIIALLSFLDGYLELPQKTFERRLNWSLITGTVLVLILFAVPSYDIHLANTKQSYDVFVTQEKQATKARRNHQKIAHLSGVSPTTDPYNIYNGTSSVTPGNPKKQWVNAWMAKFWHVPEIVLDNQVAVRPSKQRDVLLVNEAIAFYQKYVRRWQDKYLPFEEQPVVKVGSIDLVAKKQTISQDNLPADRPWLRNTKIRFVNVVDQQVVGVKRITAPYNTSYDLSGITLMGYQNLRDNPKNYEFTAAQQQTLDIKVRPLKRNMVFYFNQQKHGQKTTVEATTIKVKTGERYRVNAPTNYVFSNGKKSKTVDVRPATSSIQDLRVKRASLFMNLTQRTMRPRYLLLVALALAVGGSLVSVRKDTEL